jgi:hypothetical protein
MTQPWKVPVFVTPLAGLGTLAAMLLYGSSVGVEHASEGLVFAALWFLVVFTANLVSPRRGMLFLWVCGLLAWLVRLSNLLPPAPGQHSLGFLTLADSFLMWSLFFFPLAIATSVLLHGRFPGRYWVLDSCATALWLLLMGVTSYVAQHAPDVGGGPRFDPRVEWMNLWILVPSPLVVSLLLLCQVSRRLPNDSSGAA